ncbi:ABC transporter permease [Pseudoflavitalea rhizosphaerae]|uniref:ABC transporter permease n=1 Tax=Pseudoflavitalea rhizosphaerae TaxID=1884793 RepID=UPI000F8C8078|nr:ABC transporter permease [Pseudoflavitalea rhizosphaerae]
MPVIVKIIFREWKRIFSLPVHYWALVVMPPVLFFLYAGIYQGQKVYDLPMAVYDEDNSAATRQLIFLLEQTETIHFTRSINDYDELKDAMRKNEIMGAVHFPRRMESDIKSRKPTTVTLYTNAAYLVPAKLIYKDAAQVLLTGGSGVILQKLVKKGMDPSKAMALVQPIVVSTYSLYNPDYNYREYLVPGLITVAIQMMIIMVAVLMLNYEYTTRSMEELVLLAKGSASDIIIGKTFAHLSVSWINWILMAWVVFPAFSIGDALGGWNFFVLYSLMALACIGLGVMVSAIVKDTMLATDIGLFYTSPAFVFSGYTFPKWGMPWYDQFYSHLLPYSWFLDGFIKVFTMSLPLHYARPEISALLVFIGISYPVAILVLQRTCNKILGV